MSGPGAPAAPDGPPAALRRLDDALEAAARLFHLIANFCLAMMLVGTSATIVLRPFGLSFYWIWPWTMQFFVWMTFFGFFVVYRRHKDIAVDFLVARGGPRAMRASRWFVDLVILAVTGAILWQMPTILESQVGVIDGVVTPWGELERYTLSIPLGLSVALILLGALVDMAMDAAGMPEPAPSHLTDPDT